MWAGPKLPRVPRAGMFFRTHDFISIMPPRNPSPGPSRRQEADIIRKTRFLHAIATRGSKRLLEVYEEEGIHRCTAEIEGNMVAMRGWAEV